MSGVDENLSDLLPRLERDGYAILPALVEPGDVDRLRTAVQRPESAALRERGRAVYAVRNLLAVPEVMRLAQSPAVRRLVETILGPIARPVRGLLFDKTPDANWKVAWHQDLSIAVQKKLDLPGYGPWSVKSGVPHVQPPTRVLEQMITLRISLDDCGPDNGPLNVLPGSHAHGILRPAEIAAWRQHVPPISCILPAGGVLVMRPLLLHASSPASQSRTPHRRVIHVEFAACDPGLGLKWHESQSRLV